VAPEKPAESDAAQAEDKKDDEEEKEGIEA